MAHKKSAMTILFLVSAFLLISSYSYSAEYANPQLLVTPEYVEKNAGKIVLLDCRDEKDYAAGHIPGAINLGGACGKVLRDTSLRVKKTEDLEKMFSKAGVGMDKPVVVYADAKLITSATVAFWVLEYLGHDKVFFLNGGIDEWLDSNKKTEEAAAKLPAATFKAKVIKNRIATTAEMVQIAKGETKNATVIDSRTEKEHAGTDIRAVRGGHIPNTIINVSHIKTYDVQTGMIHPRDDLEKLFSSLDKNKRTIAYCQTGTRSTLTYLELRLLGFKEPVNYDDSWIIDGSNMDCPVANENWYDFVKVNEALKAIGGLKKAVEELKTNKQ